MTKKLCDAVKKYRIPQWPYEAGFDRVVVFSIPEDKATRKTYVEGGLIEKLDTRKAVEEAETPRAIVVSAGLEAMDYMYSHGFDIGDPVWVARLSPWRHEVDRSENGKSISFMFLRAGDLVGSEELRRLMAAGEVSIVRGEDGKHHYKFKNEAARPRFDAPSYA